jgi:AcrR family transcriptional regulator
MPDLQNPTPSPAAARPYRMRRRLEAVEQTRQRIVAATFELHATFGPSRTTIRAIADRAGVQRHTVYAHFPDLASLYEACTAHGITATSMPHPDDWLAIADPAARLRHGLAAMVDWYRTNATMLANVLLDVDPTAPPPTAPDPFEVRFDALVAALRGDRDGHTDRADRADRDDRADRADRDDRHRIVDAVLAHALAYTTWRSLADGGLDDATITALLVGVVEAVEDGRIGT